MLEKVYTKNDFLRRSRLMNDGFHLEIKLEVEMVLEIGPGKDLN